MLAPSQYSDWIDVRSRHATVLATRERLELSRNPVLHSGWAPEVSISRGEGAACCYRGGLFSAVMLVEGIHHWRQTQGGNYNPAELV